MLGILHRRNGARTFVGDVVIAYLRFGVPVGLALGEAFTSDADRLAAFALGAVGADARVGLALASVTDLAGLALLCDALVVDALRALAAAHRLWAGHAAAGVR